MAAHIYDVHFGKQRIVNVLVVVMLVAVVEIVVVIRLVVVIVDVLVVVVIVHKSVGVTSRKHAYVILTPLNPTFI